MPDPAIETRNLRKTFGDKVAVEGLTLAVPRGEVFGFLGPNGAGKSTSVKMLLGLVSPTGGDARVLGRPLGNVAVRGRIGFLPEHFRFHDWLTGEEFLRLHANLYGMPASRAAARISTLLETVGLVDHRRKRLRDYSKGMLQRIGLAQALLNDPDLIFLDEPTSGLDPIGRLLVRDIIHDQRARGATVFLNSHLLSEVEVTCDRVAFIKHGRVLEVREVGKSDTELSVVIRATGITEAAVNCVRPLASSIGVEGEILEIGIAGKDAVPEIVARLVGSGARIYSVAIKRASLEELFLRIVGTDGGL